MDRILISFIILYSLWQLIVIFQKVCEIISLAGKRKIEAENLRRGMVAIEHLCYLTPREFEEWCCLFLQKTGYEKVEVHGTAGHDGDRTIICMKDGKPVYVECWRHKQGFSSADMTDVEIVEKLAGGMVHDGVENGIVITTGIVCNQAVEYIKSLRPEYSIRIIDGEMLAQECEKLCKSGILLHPAG